MSKGNGSYCSLEIQLLQFCSHKYFLTIKFDLGGLGWELIFPGYTSGMLNTKLMTRFIPEVVVVLLLWLPYSDQNQILN